MTSRASTPILIFSTYKMEKLLIHIIPTLENGGAETVLSRLSKELKTKGIIQKVVTTQGSDTDFHFSSIVKNCEVIHAKKNQLAVQQLFKKHNQAIIIAWMYPAILSAHRWKMYYRTQQQIIWNIRRSYFPSEKRLQRWALYFFGIFAKIKGIKIIYCAHQAQRAHHHYLFPSKNSVVIQNRLAKKMDLNNRTPPPLHCDYLLYVGRKHPVKGSDRLIHLANNLLFERPKLKLLIAGRDWKIENFPSPIRSQVTLLGNVSQLVPLYTNTVALLLTSFTEGYPNVLVEGAVCGAPIVAFPAGDAPDILQDYPHGHIVHTLEKFIEKTKQIIEQPPTIKARQDAAKIIQSKFDFDHTVSDYLKFIFAQTE